MDDNLFAKPAPQPIVPTEPEAAPEGNGTPVAITAEQVQEMIAPLQQDLVSVREQLTVSEAARERLAGQLESTRNAPAPAPPANPDSFVDAFTEDPEQSVRNVAEASTMQAMRKIAPVLEQQNETIHQTLVNAHKAQVDAEYGSGAWDTHFATVFEGRVAELRSSNARALSDPNIMQNEVLGIHGLKRDALTAVKVSNTTALETAEAEKVEQLIAQLNTTGLSGGQAVAPIATSKEPSDEERAYLASRANAGLEDTTVANLRASQGRTAGTLKEYQASIAGEK